MLLISLICSIMLSTTTLVMAQTASVYESTRVDWISPSFIANYNSSKCSGQAHAAITLNNQKATKALKQKPATVIHQANLSPDDNSRSYVSWAPYWWPDCCQSKTGTDSKSNKHKRTFLTRHAKSDATSHCYPAGYQSNPTLIYEKCVYVRRDGVTNPDVNTLPCAKSWINMTSSVISNAIAYGLTRDESFDQKTVAIIRAYFLDSKTGVNPQLNYGQIVRGPKGGGVDGQNDWSNGTYRGLVEWRHMVHVVNSIAILKACKSKAWTTSDATQMTKWATTYLHWLQSAKMALQAKNHGNNMSSFYYNQVISLYMLLGNTKEAKNQANKYFTGLFMTQIDSKGNQPLEASRTRDVHYLSFGLEAMIANAKLADNLGLNMWSAKSGNGTTIQDATNYILSMANKSAANGGNGTEANDFADLAPHISAVLTAYGDKSDGRYEKYLSNSALTADPQKNRTWRLYNLPCSFYSAPSQGHTVSSQKF